MTEEMNKELKEVISLILKENPHLFESEKLPNDWYLSRDFFLSKNHIFLEKVKEKLKSQFQKEVDVNELFYMQKLYLMYPNVVPKKLLKLPWEQIKILLNLCNEEKRKFYMDFCCSQKMDEETLKKYILSDFYEKTLAILEEKKDPSMDDDFQNQVLTILPMIWN